MYTSLLRNSILKELTNFDRNPNEIEEIPELLEKYLDHVAESGDIVFKWEQIRSFLKKKIEKTVNEFNANHPYTQINQPNVKPFDFEEVKYNILNGIDSFTGPPFTIQRICELLVEPYRHYKRADKFMKGLEKNVMVISEEKDSNTNNGLLSNSTFILPSTSESIHNQQQQLSNFYNDYKENDNNLLHPQTTSTIQQLDSFTTVFVSSQSTSSPLERIANLPILESSFNLSTNNHSSNTNHTQSNNTQIANQSTIEDQPTVLLSINTENVLFETTNNVEQTPQVASTSPCTVISEEVVLEAREEESAEKESDQPNTSTGSSSDISIESSKEEESVSLENGSSTVEQSSAEPSTDELNSEESMSSTETPLENNNQINELKRVLSDSSSDEVESTKRFKSNETNESEQSKIIENLVDDESTVEQKSEESISHTHKDTPEIKQNQSSTELAEEEQSVKVNQQTNVDSIQVNECTDQPPVKESNESSTDEAPSKSIVDTSETKNESTEENRPKDVRVSE